MFWGLRCSSCCTDLGHPTAFRHDINRLGAKSNFVNSIDVNPNIILPRCESCIYLLLRYHCLYVVMLWVFYLSTVAIIKLYAQANAEAINDVLAS